MTLTATDEWGNKTTGYTGSKTLVWSGPLGSPADTRPAIRARRSTVIFTAGEGTATSLTLYDAASTTLKATEGAIRRRHVGHLHSQSRHCDAARVYYVAEHPHGRKYRLRYAAEGDRAGCLAKHRRDEHQQRDAYAIRLRLACTTNPKAAVAGVATFAGCKMKTAGTYTLTATDGTLTSVLSNSFKIS